MSDGKEWEQLGNPIAYRELLAFDPKGLEALISVVQSGKGVDAVRMAACNWRNMAREELAKAKAEVSKLPYNEHAEHEERLENLRRRAAGFEMVVRSAQEGGAIHRKLSSALA